MAVSPAFMAGHRLVGTWEAVQEAREAERRRLRDAGRRRKEACSESWRIIETRSPPALGELFSDFRRPPSLITDLEFIEVWRSLCSATGELAWMLSFFSPVALQTAQAIIARSKIDLRAKVHPAAGSYADGFTAFCDHAAAVLAARQSSLSRYDRLEMATRRELQIWRELIPELSAEAQANGFWS